MKPFRTRVGASLAALIVGTLLIGSSPRAHAHVGSGSGMGDVFLVVAGVTLVAVGVGGLVPGIHNLRDGARGVNASDAWLGGGYAGGTLSLGFGSLMVAAYVKNRSPWLLGGGAALVAIGGLALAGTIWSNTRPGTGATGLALGARAPGHSFFLPAIRF